MAPSLLRSSFLAGLAAAGLLAASGPALAQAAGCQDAQKFMTERKGLSEQLQKAAGKDKKLDPRMACTLFGKLQTNGETGMKWIEANKDWCQIPDQFAQNFKAEHDKIKELKGQACKAAAQFSEMEKKVRQQQQQQQQQKGGNPFGGGLTGQYSVPKGAL
jgi:hypothetical protein